MSWMYLVLGISFVGFLLLLVIERTTTQKRFKDILKKIYSLESIFALSQIKKPLYSSVTKIKETFLLYTQRDYTQRLRVSIRKTLMSTEKVNGGRKTTSSIRHITNLEE